MKSHAEIDQQLPEPITSEADQELADLMKLLDQRLQSITCIPFKILVWGPALRSETAIARKRRDIYEELRKKGHKTYYSEQFPRKPGISQRIFQEEQGRLVDLIILLVGSGTDGSIGEMHDFCDHPDLAPKILLLVSIELQDGYDGAGILWEYDNGGTVKLKWYQPEEMQVCNVLSKAIDFVAARQNREHRRRQRG
jgi:hypothetical protein